MQRLVVPRAGAWIETDTVLYRAVFNLVVPRAGAWIETRKTDILDIFSQRRPSRRGVD